MNSIDELFKQLGKDRVERNKKLFPYLTLRTQTVAQFFYEAKNSEELLLAVHLCMLNRIPFFLIGGGSNTAFIKKNFEGLIIKNSYKKNKIIQESEVEVDILLGSGEQMSQIVEMTVQKGWEGFEYHKGLPGTLGGAIYMNSKWMRPASFVGDSLIWARLLDKRGKVKEVKRDYFQFAYDFSILQQTKEVFLDGVFRLKKNIPELLRKRADEALAYRKSTQPFGVATCGCFFRNIEEQDRLRLNIPTTSAGYLVDSCGLKNLRRGSFYVSPIHANFIVNDARQEGDPNDLSLLLDEIKQTVFKRFGVTLQEEVVTIS